MQVHNVHKNILAKTQKNNDPGISVFVHCVVVGIACDEIVKCIPAEMVTKYNLTKFPLFAALHDIGKASPGFKEIIDNAISSKITDYDELSKKYVIRHEAVSAEWLANNHEDVPNSLIAVIRYHHGSSRKNGNCEYYWTDSHKEYGNDSGSIKWDTIRSDIFEALSQIFPGNLEACKSWKARSWEARNQSYKDGTPILTSGVKYLGGLITESDWIGSDEKISDIPELMNDTIDLDLIRSKIKDLIKDYGIDRLPVKNDLSFSNVWEGYEPSNIQNKLANIIEPHGVYVVEAPMGSGKTEAAIYAAYQAMQKGYVNGIYFALPTQTTSNSIFYRFQKDIPKICEYPKQDIRLLHSKSMFANNSDADEMESWYTGKRAILSQFGVGTLDQALASVLGNVKHFFLRSFGLANKCVIIDEIHSYDAYTGRLGIELIKQLTELDCVVIILSATLTAKARNDLIGSGLDIVDKYPLITAKVEDDVTYHCFNSKAGNKSIQIMMENVDNGVNNGEQSQKFRSSRQKFVDECIERVKSGQMVLWIENTVSEATEVYSMFSHYVDAGLLHSRFTSLDREENEKKWISRFGKKGDRTKGCILISTQVCEQSIDIDADHLVTALCPTDMLLQRMGRLFRHPNEERKNKIKPECLILSNTNYDVFQKKDEHSSLINQFVNAAGPTSMVYHPYILRKTYRILNGIHCINIPVDIRSLLEKTYAEEKLSQLDQIFKDDFENEIKSFQAQAGNTLQCSLGRDPDDGVVNMPKSRLISYPTVDVILCEQIENANIKTIYGEEVNLESKKIELPKLKAINDASVKIYKDSVVDKHPDVFVTLVIKKRTYTLAVVQDGILMTKDGKTTPMGCSKPMEYNAHIGFKK